MPLLGTSRVCVVAGGEKEEREAMGSNQSPVKKGATAGQLVTYNNLEIYTK